MKKIFFPGTVAEQIVHYLPEKMSFACGYDHDIDGNQPKTVVREYSYAAYWWDAPAYMRAWAAKNI